MNQELIDYLEIHFDDHDSVEYFPEEIESKNIVEGLSKTVVVNRYERSSVARAKCIESKGCYCQVCGIDFAKTYGDVGSGFIHVHHIVPLSKINESYVVDYEKDLIPVCPNCHAMLHRKVNGKEVSIEYLRRLWNTTDNFER